MPPAARITSFHVCPMVNPGPAPHTGGPVAKGSMNVFTGKLPQARVGDMAVCVGPTDIIVKGSSGVFVNKMPAVRVGDQTAHGGTIVAGLPTVIIGETKGGGGGGGAAPATGGLAFGFTDVAQQLNALINAWRSGAPFCEACFKNAMAEGQAAETHHQANKAPTVDVAKAVERLNQQAGHGYIEAQSKVDFSSVKPTSESVGFCASYVRQAIEYGGGRPMQRVEAAYEYGPSLKAYGYKPLDKYSERDWQVGDVVVTQPTSGHSDGHMAMYNGSKWVSDFEHNTPWAIPGGDGNYKAYRP